MGFWHIYMALHGADGVAEAVSYAITRRGTLIGQSNERRNLIGQSNERRILRGYDA